MHTASLDNFPDADIAELRQQCLALAKGQAPATVLPLVQNHDISTDLQGELLLHWASWANDPAARTARWLGAGAPADTVRDFELDGILLPVEE